MPKRKRMRSSSKRRRTRSKSIRKKRRVVRRKKTYRRKRFGGSFARKVMKVVRSKMEKKLQTGVYWN